MFQPKAGSLGRYGYINAIYVEKGHRKRGAGRLLLDEAERRLLSRGIKRIQATVTSKNRPSLDFFRERGYREKRFVVEKLTRA
jgi:ribosomal protein S18 acetylase RimI-like enzyme